MGSCSLIQNYKKLKVVQNLNPTANLIHSFVAFLQVSARSTVNLIPTWRCGLRDLRVQSVVAALLGDHLVAISWDREQGRHQRPVC